MSEHKAVFRLAAAAAVLLGLYAAWLVLDLGSPGLDHVVNDLLFILSPLLAASACAWASRLRPTQRVGWVWLGVACCVWAVAATIWAFYELVLHRYAPSPSAADLGFVGYSIPAIIGLSRLARSATGGVARSRLWLDGVVISLGLFIISWLLVLGPLLANLRSTSLLVRADSLAYPVVDIVIASVVLVQGMRAGHGARRPWALLGTGLICLAATDTMYVREAVQGTLQPNSLLGAGWVAAFLLVALAAVVPQPVHRVEVVGRLNVVQESLPLLPTGLALFTFALSPRLLTSTTATAWLALALVIAVSVRYVVMIFDHLNLANGLEATVAERTADLVHQAFHDSLTGLANRERFLLELSQRMPGPARAARCSILFIDLDEFKAINDGLGHGIGDELLQAVAHRLAAATQPGDCLARIGGDEFGLITSVDAVAATERIAGELLQALAEPMFLHGRALTVGASIGIATTAEHGETGEDLLRRADLAMYLAKSRGGGTYEKVRPEAFNASLTRMELGDDLTAALSRGELELHYQPIARLESGQYAGAEALLRWRHPLHGLLSPDRFLDLAEQTGMIVEIGEWVIDQACRELKRWQGLHTGDKALGVAVNLSGRQFGPQLTSAVRRTLDTYRLDPGCLTLEVTEGIIQADATVVSDTILSLRHIGVWLAIDDFGTGHSSMARLRDYPFDELKIDRSFVADLDRGDARFVTAQIVLAHALGMKVVAEGVETTEQLRVLQSHACDQVQGYLIGRPMPADQVRACFLGSAHVEALASVSMNELSAMSSTAAANRD